MVWSKGDFGQIGKIIFGLMVVLIEFIEAETVICLISFLIYDI